MRVLIVCLRRLGDVLLSTPLAASVRTAHPQAKIDWLVFESTAGILENNPAADQVLTLVDNSTFSETWAAIKKVAFSYHLAFSAQAGDRPTLFARAASKRAYSIASKAHGGFVRNAIMSGVAIENPGEHQTVKVLALCDAAGIKPKFQILCPQPLPLTFVSRKVMSYFSLGENSWPQNYWVLHPGAAFVYKQWTDSGWRELTQWLLKRKVSVLVSGGQSEEEVQLLKRLFGHQSPDPMFLPLWKVGLSWPELASVLSHAKGFVGVDTSVTHLATALGVPSYPIFGPTDPKIWAPLSPIEGMHKPISVIQNKKLSCVPCQLEGCQRHIHSRSDCLDTLTTSDVVGFIETPGKT